MHELNSILDKGFFDFVFIQESKLDPAFPDSFLNNKFYNLIRRDRKARAGGLLVYTKKSYQILNLVIDPVFEIITFSTLLNRIKHTFVSSYNPHFKFSPVYLVHLEDLLKTFFAKKFTNLTLIGDLNQDLLSINGDNLKSLMSAFNLKSHMNSPTRIACRKIAGTDHLSETCIDVGYSNSNLISSLECVPCPFSDHNFVILSLDAKCTNFSPSSVETRALNNSKVDLINDAIKYAPFGSLDTFFDNSAESTNDIFYAFKKLIIDALDSVAPFKTLRIKANNQPWFDDELRYATYERNRIHSFALNYPSTDPIWDRFRQFRNRCKSMNRKKMCAYFKDKSISHFKTNKKFWTFYKSVIKTKNRVQIKLLGIYLTQILINMFLRLLIYLEFSISILQTLNVTLRFQMKIVQTLFITAS